MYARAAEPGLCGRMLWVIGGSIASSLHGEARFTLDVDMVVDLTARRVKPLAALLARDYYVDAGVMRAAMKNAASFNAVHVASAIKVDFFVAGEDPFEAERLATLSRAVECRFLVVDACIRCRSPDI